MNKLWHKFTTEETYEFNPVATYTHYALTDNPKKVAETIEEEMWSGLPDDNYGTIFETRFEAVSQSEEGIILLKVEEHENNAIF